MAKEMPGAPSFCGAGCPIQGLLLALSGDFRSDNRIVAVTTEKPRSSFA